MNAPMLAEDASTYIVTALASALLAAAAAAGLDAHAAASTVNIIDDQKLRIICIIGALGGSVLSIVLFPVGNHRQLAGKLFGSSIAGIIGTPMLMRWFAIEPQTDPLLFVSCVVALLSWSILQIAVPFLNQLAAKWLMAKAEKFSPKDPKQ